MTETTIKYHEVERFENLMYKGCEPHWHCIHCDNYWPFHCYGKKDLEQMECPSRNDRLVNKSKQNKKVDMVEVVRCKDCRWYDERISMCGNCWLPREQTFFCADGKRR